MTVSREEMLALANKIEFAIRTEGKVTLFATHGDCAAAALRSQGGMQDLRQDVIEAGAQALANDVWSPPQKLDSLSPHEANKFRRQARLVLASQAPSEASSGVELNKLLRMAADCIRDLGSGKGGWAWEDVCDEIENSLRANPPQSVDAAQGKPVAWREDIENAPKEEVHFLLLKPSGLVTTAYFHWYTEGDHEAFRPIDYWALHDAVTDEPLDEDGPVEQLGFKWLPLAHPPAATGDAAREAVLTGIRDYCNSVSRRAIQNSHEGERIYYSGLLVSGLTDKITAALSQNGGARTPHDNEEVRR